MTLISAYTDYAITHGLTPFISMQNHYNLIYREEEREMFPTLKVIDLEYSLKVEAADFISNSSSKWAQSPGLHWLEASSADLLVCQDTERVRMSQSSGTWATAQKISSTGRYCMFY